MMCIINGRMNAAVLPLPVLATPITSLPDKPTGIAWKYEY